MRLTRHALLVGLAASPVAVEVAEVLLALEARVARGQILDEVVDEGAGRVSGRQALRGEEGGAVAHVVVEVVRKGIAVGERRWRAHEHEDCDRAEYVSHRLTL